MTIHQQAHSLIDMLSEESAEAVIQIMLRMLPYERRPLAGRENPLPERNLSAQTERNRKDSLMEMISASKKQASLSEEDAFSEEVDEFNEELNGFFGSDPVIGH